MNRNNGSSIHNGIQFEADKVWISHDEDGSSNCLEDDYFVKIHSSGAEIWDSKDCQFQLYLEDLHSINLSGSSVKLGKRNEICEITFKNELVSFLFS